MPPLGALVDAWCLCLAAVSPTICFPRKQELAAPRHPSGAAASSEEGAVLRVSAMPGQAALSGGGVLCDEGPGNRHVNLASLKGD